ncbi:hypothetical protein AtNW77_Chr5g0141071 [Arabidopsis thaliana]
MFLRRRKNTVVGFTIRLVILLFILIGMTQGKRKHPCDLKNPSKRAPPATCNNLMVPYYVEIFAYMKATT